ncbi:armadillo repeat-containing protein 2 isoform X1 [Erpetoichthys calabaricus]|uniref:Armadillo repeat containing 2 n=1 Tax=Erpetoichthys calabaricus TaxID=27687 RepID=A0A8C4RF26_ERPCA|nr:armadillo repeat-containing protein 2 isoform X1 [Erpetoichthys calabaricus]XP_028653446.1 armadillo repeat-containing protein 2 isoform X1 [Erpetoichthys calabaricus]
MSSVKKKTEPFYMKSSSNQKTSAEIINEARMSVRILNTKRPLTPREDERKLFGSTSTRTSDSRPPSSFSLHARSFDLPDSRPVSAKRLSPLENKPQLPLAIENEIDTPLPLPKPPVDPVKIKKVSNARARLFKATSQGALPTIMKPEELIKTLNSEPSLAKCHTSNVSEENVFNKVWLHDACLPVPNQVENANFAIEDASLKSEEKAISKLRGRTTSQFPEDRNITGSEILTGSANGSKTNDGESESETQYWNSVIMPILQDLESLQNGNDVEYLCDCCARLHCALEQGNLLGRKCKRRTTVLRILFKLIDIGSDQLNLHLSKLIFALSVTGNNLLNVCKLVFKISRSENNDILFQQNTITDSLLSLFNTEDPLSISEALLYCLGALKFISGNTVLLKDLLNKDTTEILVQFIKKINHVNQQNKTFFSISGHQLVQITTTLRNLADLPQSRPRFLGSGAFPALCTVLDQHVNDKDICTNISRLFSKLSCYNECCAAISECSDCYRLFLALLKKHQKKQDLVVRIVFTLGNLTSKNNDAREQFFKQEASIDTLLELFYTYYKMDLNSQVPCATGEKPFCGQKHPSEIEDVLIKLIRVLANLSIHPTVGRTLAVNSTCVELLIHILEYKSIDECEELVINAAATINNLSYYGECDSQIRKNYLHIAELLLHLLMKNNMEGILEAARVFGNLSQYKEIRDFIVEKKVYKFMIALLDSKNQDVCFSACGVLINLTVDNDKRTILNEEGGVKKLIDCLKDFGPTDWQLASLVCKTLWNYSERITGAEVSFGEEEAQSLLQLLTTYLEEEFALQYITDEDLRHVHKACWEKDFMPVAQQLVKRIQTLYTFLEPLSSPS